MFVLGNCTDKYQAHDGAILMHKKFKNVSIRQTRAISPDTSEDLSNSVIAIATLFVELPNVQVAFDCRSL